MNWSNIITFTFSAFFGVNAMYYAISAIGLNVQFGYSGLLNFGQAGFMACGAYAIGQTTLYYHVPFGVGILIGIAYAVLLGLVMGIPTLRLRADYLAIVTIALAEVIRLVVRSVEFKDFFGGSDGINGFAGPFRRVTPFSPSKRYRLWPFANNAVGAILLLAVFAAAGAAMGYSIAKLVARRRSGPPSRTLWAVCAVAVALILLGMSSKVEYEGLSLKAIVVGWVLAGVLGTIVWLLMRSPWGRVLKAIREDEDAVRSLGKNVYSYKMQALVLGGAMATFSGIMFSVDRGSVQPDNYSRDVTFYVLTALVLGGAAKVSGSIVGPMLFWAILAFAEGFLNELFRAWGGHVDIFGLHIIQNSSQIGQVQLMLVGVMLVLLMIFRPQGLFGNRKEMALEGR
jgi:branched-chain amino acid transport system permease protein